MRLCTLATTIAATIQRRPSKVDTWTTPTSQELHQAPLQSLHSPSARAPSLPARGKPACTCINNLLKWLHNSRIISSPRRRKPSKWHYPLLSSFAPPRPPSRPSPLPWLSGQPEREECETMIFQALGEFARFDKSRCYADVGDHLGQFHHVWGASIFLVHPGLPVNPTPAQKDNITFLVTK